MGFGMIGIIGVLFSGGGGVYMNTAGIADMVCGNAIFTKITTVSLQQQT
jgi:hypothetical protein